MLASFASSPVRSDHSHLSFRAGSWRHLAGPYSSGPIVSFLELLESLFTQSLTCICIRLFVRVHMSTEYEASQLWMLFLGYHSPRVSWDSLSLVDFSNYNWFSNYARLADPGITYLKWHSYATITDFVTSVLRAHTQSSCLHGEHSLHRLSCLLSH